MLPELNVPTNASSVIFQALRNNDLFHPYLMLYRYFDARDSKKRLSQLEYIMEKAQFPTLKSYRERILAACSSLRGFKMCSFTGTLMTRMAPGLGISTPFENGMFLHHIHGFPYIPGSVLKGIAQSYALEVLGKKEGEEDFIAVFGKQTPKKGEKFRGQRGGVIFFDALPKNDVCLFTLDVMTPHYQDYYSTKGNEPPGDFLNPNPVVFLTVKENSQFLFTIASQNENSLNDAKDWLKAALTNLGVGGKVALGYGIFKF